MKRFVNDDRGYLDWLSANPGSFVINMSRSPVAGQIVLHRASCGFIKGGRSSSSYWTNHSGKLCGNREELESFVRQADCCQLRNCGICFRDPPSHISSRRVQVTHALESSEEGPDSREVILRGQEARMAWRQYRPWFWACLVVVGVSLLAGWLLWHRSMTELISLAIGSTALSIAALIWRFGTIGFAYETSDGEATFTRRLSPLPRKIATPVLVVAGIFFILAGSPTRIGSALSPAAWDGYTVWQFGQAAGELAFTAVFIGMAITGLFSRKDRKSSGCLLALLAGSLIAIYLYGRITGTLHQEWNMVVGPFRDMWHVLSG
jgi:hypothetical protein